MLDILLFFEKLYNKSYFEAGRRPRKRSLLSVNEHFEAKPNPERALLDFFFINYSFDIFAIIVSMINERRSPMPVQIQVHATQTASNCVVGL